MWDEGDGGDNDNEGDDRDGLIYRWLQAFMVMALYLVGSPPHGPSSEAVCLSASLSHSEQWSVFVNYEHIQPIPSSRAVVLVCLLSRHCAHAEYVDDSKVIVSRRHLAKSFHRVC